MTASSNFAADIRPEMVSFISDPLMVNRHYVRNYFDLIEDTFRRVFAARNLPGDIIVQPGHTVGSAFNLTEQKIVAALLNEESSLRRLIYTLLENEGATSEQLDAALTMMKAGFGGSFEVTFEELATGVGSALTIPVAIGQVPQEAKDEAVNAIRSVGNFVTVNLARFFPPLALIVPLKEKKTTKEKKGEIEVEVKTWSLRILGNYAAIISGDPAEVFDIDFDAGVIRLTIRVKEFIMADDARFLLFKEKPGKDPKEKFVLLTEALLKDVGRVSFTGISLKADVRSDLEPKTTISQAPADEARGADYTIVTAISSLGEVHIDLDNSFGMTLIGFIYGAADFVLDNLNPLNLILPDTNLKVSGLETDLSEAIESELASRDPLEDITTVMQAYVTSITDVLMPNAYGLSKVTYEGPWAIDNRPREIEFEGIHIGYGPRSVSLRNAGSKPEEAHVAHDPGDFRPPEDGDTRMPGETGTGGGDTAVGSSFQRGMAPGAKPQQPAGSSHDDARTKQPNPLAHHATVHATVTTPTVREGTAGKPFPVDSDVWKSAYAQTSPIEASVGSAEDPPWMALSTNCVVATQLYRALRSNGKLEGTGDLQHHQESFAYEVSGCDDIAADFTGQAFHSAPALAVRGLTIDISKVAQTMPGVVFDSAASPNVRLPHAPPTRYKLDLRIKLRPRISDFVTFEPELTYNPEHENEEQPIQILDCSSAGEEDKDLIRAVVGDWVRNLPAPRFLFNCYFKMGAAKVRHAKCQDGWVVINARYPFPDLSQIPFVKAHTA